MCMRNERKRVRYLRVLSHEFEGSTTLNAVAIKRDTVKYMFAFLMITLIDCVKPVRFMKFRGQHKQEYNDYKRHTGSSICLQMFLKIMYMKQDIKLPCSQEEPENNNPGVKRSHLIFI